MSGVLGHQPRKFEGKRLPLYPLRHRHIDRKKDIQMYSFNIICTGHHKKVNTPSKTVRFKSLYTTFIGEGEEEWRELTEEQMTFRKK